MSKALTKETHWRERAGSFATRGSKRGVNLLGWDMEDTEWLSVRQEREAIQKRVKQLHDLFCAGGMPEAKRKRLSVEFNELNARLNALRPRLKSLTEGTPIQRAMVDVLKRRVPTQLWNECYEEALRLINDVMEKAA